MTYSQTHRPPIFPGGFMADDTAKRHGAFLEEYRLDRGLRWSEVARDMERLYGVSVTADYLGKIKRGAAPLARMSVDAREALRAVLGISVEEWRQGIGLYTPEEAAPSADDTPRRKGPPVPPVVPFRETPITIPRELQEMVEKHGNDYPILRTAHMQRMLAAPRAHGGPEVGPQTAEDWFDYWMANKRFLT